MFFCALILMFIIAVSFHYCTFVQFVCINWCSTPSFCSIFDTFFILSIFWIWSDCYWKQFCISIFIKLHCWSRMRKMKHSLSCNGLLMSSRSLTISKHCLKLQHLSNNLVIVIVATWRNEHAERIKKNMQFQLISGTVQATT